MIAETEFYVKSYPDIWFFAPGKKNSKILVKIFDFTKGFPQCIQDMTGLALKGCGKKSKNFDFF